LASGSTRKAILSISPSVSLGWFGKSEALQKILKGQRLALEALFQRDRGP
jgi:hypothetical protein